ncbi:unnamed protein product [Prorocentrum cordatum]|nr:unnamed protein product [Polarella glacialis]
MLKRARAEEALKVKAVMQHKKEMEEMERAQALSRDRAEAQARADAVAQAKAQAKAQAEAYAAAEAQAEAEQEEEEEAEAEAKAAEMIKAALEQEAEEARKAREEQELEQQRLQHEAEAARRQREDLEAEVAAGVEEALAAQRAGAVRASRPFAGAAEEAAEPTELRSPAPSLPTEPHSPAPAPEGGVPGAPAWWGWLLLLGGLAAALALGWATTQSRRRELPVGRGGGANCVPGAPGGSGPVFRTTPPAGWNNADRSSSSSEDQDEGLLGRSWGDWGNGHMNTYGPHRWATRPPPWNGPRRAG